MAAYARELGYDGQILCDSESRSTWENITSALRLIGTADRIKIVSNSLHAEKARLYVGRQSPELAARLVRAQDYRPGEWTLIKPVLAVYGLWDPARARRALERTNPRGN